MISFNDEHVFIRDMSNFALYIIRDTWWASMNLCTKHPIAENHSRYAPSWRFYWHCGFGGTGFPGIVYIVCHQCLRHLLEHGTSSMGKHLLVNVLIEKLKELTELEVSELTSTSVDEKAFAILKRQGSR